MRNRAATRVRTSAPCSSKRLSRSAQVRDRAAAVAGLPRQIAQRAVRIADPQIAAARGVPMGVDCVSPARHSAFDTPVGLLQFVDRLRRLSGGKPTGFKLAIGHPWEWFAIAKAMQETGLRPDFIVVDGAEGGTGAAPLEFTDHVGAPLQEGLLLVHNTLVGLQLRQQHRRVNGLALGSVLDLVATAGAVGVAADARHEPARHAAEHRLVRRPFFRLLDRSCRKARYPACGCRSRPGPRLRWRRRSGFRG